MKKIETTEYKFFEIEEQEGIPKRITIESNVSLDEVELQTIQERLKNKVKNFKPTEIIELHLTLGHFGKPDELYEELLRKSPGLERALFNEKIQDLLFAAEKILPEDVDTYANEIKTFEGGAVVLVIKKEKLTEIKQGIYDATIKFLNDIGISDSENYLRSEVGIGSNLYYLLPERWNPHITLGRIKSNDDTGAPPIEIIERVSLPVKILPSHVHNAWRI